MAVGVRSLKDPVAKSFCGWCLCATLSASRCGATALLATRSSVVETEADKRQTSTTHS